MSIRISEKDTSIELFTPNDKPYGMSYGEWTVKWWQWMISIPMNSNPAADEDGRYAGINQTDPYVWFLAGTLGGMSVNRRCRIPLKRSILFPVINIEINPVEQPSLKSPADMIRYVTEDEDDIIDLDAQVNGQKVPIYRVRSDPVIFPLKIPNDNPFKAPGDIATMATSDGYWVFLKSLDPGEYHLYFSGSCSLGTRNVKASYTLTVVS